MISNVRKLAFARRVQAEARARGLTTQAELAANAGMNDRTLRWILEGDYKTVTGKVRDLAAAVGIPAEEVDQIFTGDDPEPGSVYDRARELVDMSKASPQAKLEILTMIDERETEARHRAEEERRREDEFTNAVVIALTRRTGT